MKTEAFFLCVLLLRFPSNFYADEHKVFLQDNGDKVNINVGLRKVVRSSIAMAVSDFYNQNREYRTRIALHVRDSRGDSLHCIAAGLDCGLCFPSIHARLDDYYVLYASSLACMVILWPNVEVHTIIIPKISNEELLLARLVDKANVPLLSLSSTPTSNEHPYFIQLATDENNQFHGISAFLQAFKWRRFVFFLTYIHDILQENHLDVAYETAFSLRATDDQIINELHKVLMIEVFIILVHFSPSLSSQVFINGKMLGMMSKGFGWIVTSKTMDFWDFLDSSVYESMQGVIGFKTYVSESSRIQNLTLRWKRKFYQTEPDMEIRELSTFGALAETIESAGMKHTENWAGGAGLKPLDLARLRVSNIGLVILIKITGSKFREFVGEFQLHDIYEILNVIGGGERRVCFWNSAYGLMKEMNPSLVNFYHDQQNNKTTFGGVCIDVFHAAIDRLRYEISFEYIPFYDDCGSYSDLVYQNYDAVVGDITILSNGSKYVDCTLPYTESGLGVVVKLDDKEPWFFLKPLQPDLWITSAYFFFLTGLIVWLVEHPISEEFQGPPAWQTGTVLWFTASTLVYAHRERLQSNVFRFVVSIWMFVVLILTSSYVAKLSSLLTVEHIKLTESLKLGINNFLGLFIINGISKFVAALVLSVVLLRERLSNVHLIFQVLEGGKLTFMLRYLSLK
ncbi:hypothetical protein CDL12_10982 [Handroanthus impetiginosus]|uniref:Ionotropic glutamate receptor C-terminal domain-containing protein n=1 Tax=Handroanthus impetiginosus TaxID=429701 RepID=A0A2G9HFP4_9LAMI|nr:hypothetical protein CDL12_10982 [Handroanthus impetiginosus]